MKSFRRAFLIGTALLFGDFLFRNSVDIFFNWLSSFFRFVEQSFSFGEVVLTVVLAPFVLSFLWELISETASESNYLPSFLIHLLGNIVIRIMAVVLVIGGLYVFLERERDRIPTYNGILLGGSGISESKLKHNRRLRDELEEQIQDKQRELRDKQSDLDD